ncbi:MAG: 50S ribosomal protein L24 [Nitrosomonas sp.]|jgi:large subunit ribosomal protein L24|nr:50S ribosomal protein L24 [Nitrosomonas sp.]
MRKIKKGDDVVVLSGKDKGKRGSVVRIVNKNYAQIQNVNVQRKHQKPNPSNGTTGGIITVNMPVHLSNVAIFNSSKNKHDRVGFNIDSEGNKTRIFRSTAEKI